MLAAPPQLSDGSTTWRKGVAEPARARTQIEPNRLMSLAAVLLTPLILLLPVSGAVDEDSASRDDRPVAASGQAASTRLGTPQPATSASDPWEGWTFSDLAESFRVRSQEQVRIEQHMTIRIAPRPGPVPVPAPQNFLMDVPRNRMIARTAERDIGRCLPVSGIAGVQADAGGRLILFMRDRRMVSAVLERACRARDFYSGFYVQRTIDGQMCVDRDSLLSRSGANCKLSRIRQLIKLED